MKVLRIQGCQKMLIYGFKGAKNVFLIFLTFTIIFFAPNSLKAEIERVSIADDGTQGNDKSNIASVSADGRYVAFMSDASNLVANDTNGVTDIFVYDRNADTIERVSVASDGTEGNNISWYPCISADGRYVAFSSRASNLVANDNNNQYDVFIYDRNADTIERIVGYDGAEGNLDSRTPSISSDGRYVAFDSDAVGLMPDDVNGFNCIYIYDKTTTTLETIVALGGNQPNEASYNPSISADGRYVAFQSYASNLVSGDANIKYDIFVLDRNTDTIERVSVANDGTQGNDNSWKPSISADGRYVAFESDATNLIANDINEFMAIFVYDRNTDTIERVSVADDGTQGDNHSYDSSISSDGRYVAFDSLATNLVSGDTNGASNVYVYDRTTDTIEYINISYDATEQSGASSQRPSISSDGKYVAFDSDATNLVANDTNLSKDVFVASSGTTESTTTTTVGTTTTTTADSSTTTTADTTTTTTKICLSKKIYGENSEKVELLRYFRDDVLSQTPEGREIIRLYYRWSPVIVKAMEEDEKFKEEVKVIIDEIFPLIRGEVE